MSVIYRFHNLINDKNYIGQTKDFTKRMRHYRSYSQNPDSKEFHLPIMQALNKYGFRNFEITIIEEIDSDNNQLIDEREKYWIRQFHSLVGENGYNISTGGQGNSRPSPMTYEEKIEKSSIFSSEEIKDIQSLLINNSLSRDIIEKYKGRLSMSFLQNINAGLNFNNPDFNYPLRKELWRGSFTKEQINEIKNLIKSGMIYSEIREKYGIKTDGFISMINSGKTYFDKNETYPLCIKSCNKKFSQIWADKIIYDLIHTNKTLQKIADDNEKSISTVKNVNNGYSHKDKKYTYPLRKNSSININI